MDKSDFKLLLKNKKINKKIKQIAKELDKKYKNDSLVLVCVLKGAIKFYNRLLYYLKHKDVELDFIQVQSYVGTSSSGKMSLIKDLSSSIEGKNVVLVEDIVDEGFTADFLFEHVKKFNPKSMLMCSLVKKQKKTSLKIKMPLLVGFEIENKFVIGFGLDLNEKYRNLNDILVLKES